MKIPFIGRSRLVFVPASGATVKPDAVRVRFPKKLVHNGLSIDTDGELSVTDEPGLFAYYELDYGSSETGQRRLARRGGRRFGRAWFRGRLDGDCAVSPTQPAMTATHPT